MRLLIAEPTRSLSELVHCIAEEEGFECDTARSYSKLFEQIDEHTYDIICLAPNIGKESGIDTLKKIRKIDALKFIPIFLFTSTPESSNVRRAITAGATDLIAKSDFESLRYFLHRFRDTNDPLDARILVIEDSASQQEIFLSLLSELGCEVDFSDNANDAFDTYQKGSYDLVITDIVLKGAYSGMALAGRIRRLKSVSGDVPILAVTGYADPSREASLFSYGVSDYIKKPIEPIKFCRQVRSLVKSYRDYRQLDRKTQELVDSDKQRVQFWANLSHEIRTPLNGVIGSLELINEKDVSNDKEDYLNAAKNSSEMLLSLVNDILELTKAESGELDFERKSINLEQVMGQQVRMIKAQADKKELEINYELDKHISKYIECDLTRFNQVVANLLNNAVKFTSKGGVTLSCKKLEAKSDFIEFAVTDTGIGIAEQEQDRVFDKFKQANPSIENSYGGTGIGLHIVKLIVSMWGGDLSLVSVKGSGSTFSFTMPLIEVNRPTESVSSQLNFSNIGNRKVLVVDDSEVNLMIAEGLLSGLSLQCDVAISGEEAINMIVENSYDCVFMDCQMPIMSGLEATKKIRKLDSEYAQNVPIVALTAHTADIYQEKCLAAGMNGFLEKPFRRASIINMLNRYVK